MAWWVVAGHVAIFFSDRIGNAIHNDSAVLVFIALSGFVIASLICEKQEAYGPYLLRRAFRIWPAYLVALALSAATLPLQASALANAPFQPAFTAFRLGNVVAARQQFWWHLGAHVTLAQGLVPEAVLHRGAYALLGQAWSLSVEIQFYLLAPMVVALLSLGRFGVAAALGLGAGLFLLGHFGPLADNAAFIGRYAPWFAVGVGSYYLWRDGERRVRLFGAVALCALLALVAVVKREPAALAWIAVLAAILWAPSLRRVLSFPLLRRLGEVSYSTYLFHMLPLLLGAYVLNGLGLDRAVYAAALSLITVAVTLLMSLVSYRYVERPAMRLGARLAATWGARGRTAVVAA